MHPLKHVRALTASAILTLGFSAYADSYDISVQTFVGGKLEDTFSFVLSEGKFQEKGFDTKLLAKRYRAAGWIHPEVAARGTDKGGKEGGAEEEVAGEPKKPLFEQAKEKLSALETEYSKLEMSLDRSKEKLAYLGERVKALGAAVEKGSRNRGVFPAAYKDYMDKYEPLAEQEENYEKLMKKMPRNTGDVEEVFLGSYCRMALVKEGKKSIAVDLDYAYSRVMSYFYSDGNNNDNSITKHPVFERFEKLGMKKVKLPFGTPYCIQLGRPTPTEARSLQDALESTSIFSGTNAGGGAGAPRVSVKPEYEASALDAQGPFDEIRKKYSLDSGKTLRVVITAKKAR